MTVRPSVTSADVTRLVREQYGLTVTATKEFPAFEDRNFLVTCRAVTARTDDAGQPSQYVVKISGSRDTQSDAIVDKQQQVMEFLSREQFICSQFVKTLSGSWFHWEETANGAMRVRMLTYVPGDPLMDHWEGVCTRDTLVSLGELVAQLHLSLEKLTHSGNIRLEVDTDDPWRLDNFLSIRNLLGDIEDVTKRRIAVDLIRRFQDDVLSRLDSLSKGIIHGDVHDMNIIVNVQDGKLHRIRQDGQAQTSAKQTFGIIDFGDISLSCYVFEISMVIRDAIVDVKTMDTIEIAGHILAGYVKHRTLNSVEWRVLFVCILVALCQYVVLGEHEYKLQPDNEYTKLGADDAWVQLQLLHNMDESHVLQKWTSVLSSRYGIVIDAGNT